MKLKAAMALALLIPLTGTMNLFALDIPLSGAGGQATGGGLRIAYVDMDRIFQLYPQTQNAKEDYAKQLKKKREQLSAKESELSDIESRISVLESTMKQNAASPQPPEAVTDSTATAQSASPDAALSNVSQSIATMKQQLEDKKAELLEVRKQAKTELASFERQQSQLILGKIYEALRDVAAEEQVSVVVDKSSILYGESSIDLTEKLQQRVRGF